MFSFLAFTLISSMKINTDVIKLNKVEAEIRNMLNLINDR